MKIQSSAVKENMHQRLRRIEGQVQGVQRMLDADRDCGDIVQQLRAIRAALDKATTLFVQAHARECLLQGGQMNPAEQVELIDSVLELMTKTY